MLSQILANEVLTTAIVGGISWLAAKLWGKRQDSKLAKVTTGLATASALMTQYALAYGKDATATKMITAFKGIAAIQLARVGFTEAQRAPYQPLIDAAIAAAVTRWLNGHADASSVSLPIADKLHA